jgi:hypothetical protein
VQTAAHDHLLTQQQADRYHETNSLFTFGNGLPRFAAEASCLLVSKSSQKDTIGLENYPKPFSRGFDAPPSISPLFI